MNVPWPASLPANSLADHLWQSTVFALAIWLLSFLLRNNQARIRYALWLAASFKFLLPFSLLITLGSLLPQPATRAVSATPETIYSAVDFATQPFAGWEPTPAARHTPTRAELFAAHLPTMLLALWITGALAVLLTWLIRWRSLNATFHHAVPTHAGRELRLLRRVEAALPARSPLPLRLSAELIEPGIFGIFRPVLVWPQRLTDRLEDEHIEAILTHELMHVRRRDNLTAAIHMLVEAALWFHPLVWWIGRRLVDERERACDEAVVQLGGRAEAYAESLLKACRFCIESPLPCVSGITGAHLSHRVRSIMTAAFAAKLTPFRKTLLASAAFAVLAVPVALGVIRFFPVSAQILHATGPLPSFEVASIRPWQPRPRPLAASPNGTVHPTAPMKVDPAAGPGAALGQRSDRVHFIGNARELIAAAYNLAPGQENKIIGAPEWVTQGANRYEVQAKIEDSMYTAMQKMSTAEQHEQVELMEQSLLGERFKLKVHFETRQMPVYALVVAPGGPKLTPAKDGELNGIRDTREDEHGTETTGTAVTLDQFVHSMILFGGRLVVDQTGLKGKYDFRLTWAREQPNASASEEIGSDAPPLSAAVQQQLGLKLVPSKAPVEVIVVDHIERPTLQDDTAPAPPPATSQAPPPATSGPMSQAQTVASAEPSKPLAFEVVSIRENKSGERRGRMVPTGDGWRMVNLPFEALLQVAFVPKPGGPALFPSGYIIGMPDWGRDRYDVEAKVPQSVLADWQKPTEQPAMLHAMIQTMLAERCGLKVHRDSKTVDILALEVAKGGPKLKPADPNAPPHPEAERIPGMGFAVPEDGGRTIHFYGANMALLLNVLDKPGTLNIQDRTGLTGTYDFVIHLPEPPAPVAGEAAPRLDPRDFADAVAEQIGLKLVPTKGQVETLVIEHIDRPTEN